MTFNDLGEKVEKLCILVPYKNERFDKLKIKMKSENESKLKYQKKSVLVEKEGTLREKSPNTEFFLVRIFLYSDWTEI